MSSQLGVLQSGLHKVVDRLAELCLPEKVLDLLVCSVGIVFVTVGLGLVSVYFDFDVVP